jgi:hypothetical protein
VCFPIVVFWILCILLISLLLNVCFANTFCQPVTYLFVSLTLSFVKKKIFIFYYHISVVQGGFIVMFTICLQCILIRFTHSIILPHPPLCRTISTSFKVQFSCMYTKYVEAFYFNEAQFVNFFFGLVLYLKSSANPVI